MGFQFYWYLKRINVYIIFYVFIFLDNAFELFVICHFCEFYLLKSTNQWNPQNNYNMNWFRFKILLMCTLFMYVNRYNMLLGSDFIYKKFLILIIFSKEDNCCVFEIWIFWTAVIGSLTVFNAHHWQFHPHIPQCDL